MTGQLCDSSGRGLWDHSSCYGHRELHEHSPNSDGKIKVQSNEEKQKQAGLRPWSTHKPFGPKTFFLVHIIATGWPLWAYPSKLSSKIFLVKRCNFFLFSGNVLCRCWSWSSFSGQIFRCVSLSVALLFRASCVVDGIHHYLTHLVSFCSLP